MKRILWWIKLVLGLSIILSVTSIIIYITNFKSSNIANDTQTWGAFGDYIGGVISAIVGIVNLFLLVAIAVFVEKLNNHRHLNEFRYYSLTALHNQFDSLEYTANSLKAFKHQIDNFYSRNSFLFSKDAEVQFTTAIKRLSDKLSTEIAVIADFKRSEEIGEIDEEEFDLFANLRIKPNEPMNDIKDLYDDLIALIQKQILSQD